EPGTGETDLTTRELGIGKVPAVEHHTGEVKVQAPPGTLSAWHEVSGDDLENSAAAVAGGIDLRPFLRWGARAGVRRIWHPQVRTEHGDTSLPILRPVIGEPCDRAYPGQLSGGPFVSDLRARRPEPLVEYPGLLKLGFDPVKCSNRPGEAPVDDDQSNQR